MAMTHIAIQEKKDGEVVERRKTLATSKYLTLSPRLSPAH
jgi:hypothetical protein